MMHARGPLTLARVCELSEKNAFCMFYLAPTRGATTFRARARSRNVVAPLVGARIIHRPWCLRRMNSWLANERQNSVGADKSAPMNIHLEHGSLKKGELFP